MKDIQSKNPYNGDIRETYFKDMESNIAAKLEKALSIGTSWDKMRIQEIFELLTKVADLLLDRKEKYAELIPKEMSKPMSQSIAEIKKYALVCLSKSLSA
tara:strand:- start:1419 stop:1718 length:300 start_codon:yes stop_codon:yes gene_type:complete